IFSYITKIILLIIDIYIKFKEHFYMFISQNNSYWKESVRIPSFSSLEETSKANVGIVGAGITGITTAYLLSKLNVNVILLEADTIFSGTTGNTTAKITAQHGLIYDELISKL